MAKPITILLTLFALGAVANLPASAADAVDVYKSPYCGCCEKWVEHLRQAGFDVRTHDVNDVPAARQRLGMPERLGSCHTAKVAGYVVEGHVPAADIQRLLKEKPKAVGLAVPSMPPGSPGMESPKPVPYNTLLVQAGGATTVFAKH
ncbi:MAG: DUF411 domain-containing protein [Dechloromonas sp.]|nr:DUF411 domain-containing protein [Dechloromonas sp.]